MTEYISATPEPAGPAKPRPRVVWFVVGALLVVAGILAGVVLFVRIFDSGFLSVEATIPADGAPHPVTVATDGDRYLWEQEHGAAECVVRDADTGGAISLDPVNGTITRSVNGDAWQAIASFDPGSGHLSVTCSADEGPAQIGPALVVGDFVLRIVLAVVVPLLLFGLGLALLIGTTILWFTRPARTD
ncbi:hypothetical protein [Nocardioides dilutus]